MPIPTLIYVSHGDHKYNPKTMLKLKYEQGDYLTNPEMNQDSCLIHHSNHAYVGATN
jgi:hypothetical protein